MLAFISSWLATPLGAAVLIWFFVALTTLVFKPQTPAEYESVAARTPKWFWTRWAAFWQFLGGLGIDPVKAGQALAKILAGSAVPAAMMARGADLAATLGGGGGTGGGANSDGIPTPVAMQAAPPTSGTQPKARAMFRPLIVAMLTLALGAIGCSGSKPTDAKDAITVTNTVLTDIQRACVIANAVFPVKLVEQVCSIANPVASDAEQLLTLAQAAGAANPRAVPVTCEKNAAGAILCVKPYVFADAGAQ